MKQLYKDKIAWLYKKKQRVKDATVGYTDSDLYESEGIPFYCSQFDVTRNVAVPMSNSYRTVSETLLKTTEDLDFQEHDRITFEEIPQNNVNQQDFSMIVSAIQKPRLAKGRKYRNVDYYEWHIRTS